MRIFQLFGFHASLMQHFSAAWENDSMRRSGFRQSGHSELLESSAVKPYAVVRKITPMNSRAVDLSPVTLTQP
ncbi:hypothetical protein SAMN02744035_03546 [Thalassobacter stenotrophicus DSM 16310]|uniref:Uncharacterized protein n=1 Tax=Thalassobacter stenotrophicus DSM 16310 TaxID=1123361 RepID=A0ABY1ILB6_9RHOB|nr:hypothetical protein SAMN02744035_03546 [Thalassobacter stenotrophicus DSM 16310]